MKTLALRAGIGLAFMLAAAGSSLAQERTIIDFTGPGAAAITPQELERALILVAPAPQQGMIFVPAAAAQTSVMAPLEFAINSATVSPQSFQFLIILAQALNLPQLAGRTIVIEGHTDLSGTFQYNMYLSQMRAEAVRAVLIGYGVAPQRLYAIGVGPQQLLPGLSPYSARNRRVEIVNTL